MEVLIQKSRAPCRVGLFLAWPLLQGETTSYTSGSPTAQWDGGDEVWWGLLAAHSVLPSNRPATPLFSPACWELGFQAWAQSTCPELSAQGLVPLRWGCALPSPNAPGKAPNHTHTTLRWGRAAGKPSRAGAFWAQTEDPSGGGAASPRQGRWVPHSLRPALRLGGQTTAGERSPGRSLCLTKSSACGRLWQFSHPRPLSLLQRGLAPRFKGKAGAELRPARRQSRLPHSRSLLLPGRER